MKKVLNFLFEKKYIVMGLLCVLLMSLVMKTQDVVVAYGEEYSLRMEYSLFGYCVRASVGKKATEPALHNEVYFGGSIEDTVKKAVKQMDLLSEKEETVGVVSLGFPQNNSKLEKKLKKMLTKEGYDVEILDSSMADLFK